MDAGFRAPTRYRSQAQLVLTATKSSRRSLSPGSSHFSSILPLPIGKSFQDPTLKRVPSITDVIADGSGITTLQWAVSM